MNLNYNSSYISLNLIDELDYVIGGYGKPNSIFIYSLNTFLEAFITNSTFYLSVQEFKHLQIVSKSMFPNGRPILELLSKTKKLQVIGGIGNSIGQVVSIEKFNPENPTSYQERIKNFIENGHDTKEIREKYLIIPKIESDNIELPYLNIGKVEDGFVATVHKNKPQRFFTKLLEVTNQTNIQAALPFYSFQYQIEECNSRGIGKEIITNLTTSFNEKHDKLNQYFGYKTQIIPPLITILLTQCKSITDIPNRMLQLRDDFTELRTSIINYEKRINEATSIKDQIEAIDELDEFWKVLTKKYSDNKRILYNFWEVAQESEYEKSIDNAVDNETTSEMLEDINVGKVAGKGVKKVYSWYKERKIINRFKGVTDIWKLFESSPNLKEHIPLFEKLFEVKVNKDELIRINSKLNTIKRKNDQ